MYISKMIGTRYYVIIFAVLANVKSNVVKKTIYIDTTGGNYYQILPLDWFVKYKRIHFKVQALEDAYLAFLTEDNPLFEVAIGAEKNTISSIKKNKKVVASVDTPGILDPGSYKGFWISWHTNSKYMDLKTVFVVRVGHEGEDSAFLTTWDSYNGPPPTAYYIGVRTGHLSGSGFWEIDVMYDQRNITGSTLAVVTNAVLKKEPDYDNFYRIFNQRIDFKVKIRQDAWICLSKHPQRLEDSIQIVLGGWGNTRCVIITGYSTSKIVVDQKCDGACNSEYFRGFWISLEEFDNTLTINVGNDGEILPFMKYYTDVSGKLPSYYSVACTGRDRVGYWILKVAPPQLYKYIKTVRSKPVSYLSFDPIPKSGLIVFKTKATRDVFVGLSSSLSNDPDFEIIIGGWDNTKSTIRKAGKDLAVYNNKLLETGTRFAGFWINVRQEELMYEGVVQELYLHIQVGQEDLGKPFMQYNHTLDKFNPMQLKLYSVASALDTDSVEWILEASVSRIDPVIPKYYITHDNPNKYYLYALEGNRVEFELKTIHNAIVSLTTSSHKPNIELSIANEHTKIFKDGSHMATFDTYFLMNNKVYQGFYIDWKYISKPRRELCLRFGYQGEDIALVEWRDPEPFFIKYIGVETRNGIGYWKFNDAWLESESEKFMPNLIRTYNDPERYQFFPIIRSPIRFKVKASRDANLAFTTNGERSEPILEVLLGAFGKNWLSQYTYIRRDFQQYSPAERYIQTPDILSGDKFTGFWINWEYIEDYSSGFETKMMMEVGLEGEEAFLTWEGKDMFPINYVGVTSYRSSAVWIFEDDVKIIERKKWREVATQENYKFFPVLNKPLWLQVKASSNAYIALTSSKTERILPILECMIGTVNNTKTIMLLNRNKTMGKYEGETINILSDSYYESFWLDWNNFTSEVGKAKMTVYIGRRGDHNHFASLIIDQFDIHFFGIGSKGNQAFWHFQEFPGILPPYITTYNHSKQYQFYIAPNHALKVHIKAASDAYIALSTSNSSSDVMYEIMIGAESNQKSFIKKNKTIQFSEEEEQLPFAQTENILSNTDLRGFWIDWVYRNTPWNDKDMLRIRVGRQGEVQPFLRWYDRMPLPIKYIGFTGANDNSLWKFEEITEDILPGEFVDVVSIETKEYDFSPQNYTEVTTNNLTYRFFSLPGQNMSFKVKTQSDAYIVLSSRPQINSLFPSYEILLGARNRNTWIRRSNDYPKTIVNTPLLLNVSESRGFWVSWVDENIEVGFMNKKEAFVRLTDPDKFKINFIGITSRFSAVWQIIDTTIQTNDKYQFFPIAADKTVFLLKGSENAKIILTNTSKSLDPLLEVILGSINNAEITFRGEDFFYHKKVGEVLHNNIFRGYWFSWALGMFAVGRKGESQPLADFHIPRSISPNYIGFAGYTTKITWQLKVTPVWKPVQWENQNDNPCFMDPEGQECKDRKLNLNLLKKNKAT